MDCRQARALMHAALDDELDVGTQLEFDEHVAACPACAERREAGSALRSLVGAGDLYYRAPAGLERRVVAAVRASGRPAFAARLWQPLGALSVHRLGFAASALSVVLALALGVVLGRRTTVPPLTDAIVDAHVRSLMPGHLTDQASSEHHAVKPWFAGRLDFSPPVPDLSASGFTLAGARIDYAGGRPVAALVYRRRQHVINLFVWPPAGEPPRTADGSKRGYNFVRGRVGPNEAWAVSDLNLRELREFMRLIQQAS